MNFKFLYLGFVLLIFSCSQKNIERDLLISEINRQILEGNKRISEMEQGFLAKHEDKPDWYKEKIEKQFTNFRISVDSILKEFEKVSNKQDLIKYHKSLEFFADKNGAIDNYEKFYLNPEIEDKELQILYNQRAITKLHFDHLQGYYMGLISFPLSEIYPDEFEQYKYLKEKFKAYEE